MPNHGHERAPTVANGSWKIGPDLPGAGRENYPSLDRAFKLVAGMRAAKNTATLLGCSASPICHISSSSMPLLASELPAATAPLTGRSGLQVAAALEILVSRQLTGREPAVQLVAGRGPTTTTEPAVAA